MASTRLLVDRQPNGQPSKALLCQQRKSNVDLPTRYTELNTRQATDRRNSLQLQPFEPRSGLIRLLSADLTAEPALMIAVRASAGMLKATTPIAGQESTDARSPEAVTTVKTKAESASPVTSTSRPTSAEHVHLTAPEVDNHPSTETTDHETSDEYEEYDFEENFKYAEESALREQSAMLRRSAAAAAGGGEGDGIGTDSFKGSKKKKKRSKRSFRLSRRSKRKSKSPSEPVEAAELAAVSTVVPTVAIGFLDVSPGGQTPSRTSSAAHSQRSSHLDLSETVKQGAISPVGSSAGIVSTAVSISPPSPSQLHPRTSSREKDRNGILTTPTLTTAGETSPTAIQSTTTTAATVTKKSAGPVQARPRAMSNIAASLRFVPVPAMAVAGFSLPGENLMETRFYSAGRKGQPVASAAGDRAGGGSAGDNGRAGTRARLSIGTGLSAAMAAATGALAVGSSHRGSPLRASYHGKSARQSQQLHVQFPVDRRLLNADNVRMAGASNTLEVIGSAESLVSRVLQEQGLGMVCFFRSGRSVWTNDFFSFLFPPSGQYCDPQFLKTTQKELAEALDMTPEEMDRAAHRLLQVETRLRNQDQQESQEPDRAREGLASATDIQPTSSPTETYSESDEEDTRL